MFGFVQPSHMCSSSGPFPVLFPIHYPRCPRVTGSVYDTMLAECSFQFIRDAVAASITLSDASSCPTSEPYLAVSIRRFLLFSVTRLPVHILSSVFTVHCESFICALQPPETKDPLYPYIYDHILFQYSMRHVKILYKILLYTCIDSLISIFIKQNDTF